jgi:epoxyqueuosine reductase
MLSQRVKQLANDTGFELAGVTAATPLYDASRYRNWVAAGMAGTMAYLTDHRADVRTDPRKVLPSARSVICVAKLYNRPEPPVADPGRGWISRYAWGEDYHDVLRRDLTRLVERLQAEAGPFEYKICVDTAPLLERSLARDAGLGWIGKNTCLINQQIGSWVFLAEVLTSLELEPDMPAPDRCGTCTRCIDACPTAAFVPDGDGRFHLDARRCISYLTIEHRGDIPDEFHDSMGNHVFGCDVCQDVCPWNRRAPFTGDPAFAPREYAPALDELATLTPDDFRRRFRKTPVWRTKFEGLRRNVAIAIGKLVSREA